MLNLLNGADECSDQMAASAVYNLPSSVSSHSFTSLYAVDFINYVKSGGKSLQEDSNVLDLEDLDSDVEEFKEDDSDVLATIGDSGLGQGAKPVHDRLSEDEGGGIRITIARDIQDYMYCGDALSWLPPYVYKSLIRRQRYRIFFFLGKVCGHSLIRFQELLYFFFRKPGKKNTSVFFFPRKSLHATHSTFLEEL